MNATEKFRFTLYIAGDAPNSVRASANLDSICRNHLADRHVIEVVDVLRDPQRALADGVYLTPMLIKLSPSPARRIVGSLSELAPVLDALGLSAA